MERGPWRRRLPWSPFFAAQGPAGSGSRALSSGWQGAWRGEGSIDWKTGETERMRCTAKYEVENEGNRLIQNLTCATDSTRLVVKSTITYNPDAGAITGTWAETSYGINGFVTGNAGPGKVQGPGEEHRQPVQRARQCRTLRGDEQTVSILPQEFRRHRSRGDAPPRRQAEG